MRDFSEAIRIGENNRDTAVLVANFCANARVARMGGGGTLEATTGLPIGHQGLECDYAPAGGMMSWDLRVSVTEFYDRNCSSCTARKAVRLPNMLEIVGERDRARAVRERQEAEDTRRAEEEFAARNLVRAALRPRLGPVAVTLLDDIAAYDAERSTENFDRVTKSARLAPDRFSSELIHYVYDLGSREHWFARAAIIILDAVGGDDQSIAKLATDTCCLFPTDEVAEKLLPRLSCLSADDGRRLVAGAIDLAAPDREFMFGDGEHLRPGDPRLLISLSSRNPKVVLEEIERLLLSGRRFELERAGRGIRMLQGEDPGAAKRILRTIVSVYVRAPALVSDMEDESDRLPQLADALNGCFDDAPEEVDRLLQELAQQAPETQRERIYKVYALALDVAWDDPPVPSGSLRHAVALKRLIWAATTEKADKPLQEILSAFRSGSRGLTAVVREQLEAILGSLFLLADRLAELTEAAKVPPSSTIESIERMGHRATVWGLMKSFVEWASSSAVGDGAAVARIIDMFDEIPEGRDELLGALLGSTKSLVRDLAGLKRLLPHLYHALVGPSVLGRAYAATAVGEIPYSSLADVPDLLFEAFGALLWDQYVAVHKSAAEAFRRSILPEAYRPAAAQALLNLVSHYRTKSNEDKFTADCLRSVAGMADIFGSRSGAVRRYLIEVAMGLDPLYLRSDIQSLTHTLGEELKFAKLVARMIRSVADRYNRSTKGVDLLRTVRPEGLRTYAGDLHRAALAVLADEPLTALAICESFLLAGMSSEADELIGALISAIGDTVRMRRLCTLFKWPQLAALFEAAVATGHESGRTALRLEWSELASAALRDKEDARERRARSSLPG